MKSTGLASPSKMNSSLQCEIVLFQEEPGPFGPFVNILDRSVHVQLRWRHLPLLATRDCPDTGVKGGPASDQLGTALRLGNPRLRRGRTGLTDETNMADSHS